MARHGPALCALLSIRSPVMKITAGFCGQRPARRPSRGRLAQKPAVIFMTGDLIESSAQSAGRGGPFWLQKPFRVSDVLALLRDVLSGAPAETHPNR